MKNLNNVLYECITFSGKSISLFVVSLGFINMRLKRWESPRREGRNDKGRGGSARQRQLKKQQQMLRKKLKEGGLDKDKPDNTKNKKKGEEKLIFPFFLIKKLCHMQIIQILSWSDWVIF
ncbi:hypothetical protein [Scytonema sp. NUACC26]|uniref:hypothetical protein n=1 Tax=Scytonema sp. NUACC26 TaxID=3140176 RepID=UPI0034DBF232